ncbi:MAG TPA: D-alanine--D-alanine ligase [Syntrophales bacterium]|nr:D-alanine--D-alanine ligase [Syntrophales bacterium]
MAAENPDKLRVGVILGGVSSEREVSLESGRNIFSKMDRKKYNPTPIFMDSRCAFWEIPIKLLMRNSTADIEIDLNEEAQPLPYEALKDRFDFIYIGLHGKYGEDGSLQGLLELLRIPYSGSGVLGSALGMDKFTSRKVLAMSGIDVPKTVPVEKRAWDGSERNTILKKIETGIGFPCVVKPTREGCSTAVKKVVAPAGIPDALASAFEWDNVAVVEEFINGMEVTCGVIGNENPRALTPSETIPTQDILSLEDKFLYGQGENKTPARVSAEVLRDIQDTAVRAYRALNLRAYSRIDMFISDRRILVLEPNTLPGMTPSTVLFHQAAAEGLSQTDLISRIIEFSLEAHRMKKGPL